MDGLKQIDGYIGNGLKDYQTEVLSGLDTKVDIRLKKIQKFLDSIKQISMNEKQNKVFKETNSYLTDLKENQLNNDSRMMVKGLKQKMEQIRSDQNSFRFSSIQNDRKYNVQ